MNIKNILQAITREKKLSVMNNFRAPMGGERVHVICKNRNCDYRGYGILDGPRVFISHTLADTKCPKCKKHTLIMDPTVMY